MEILLCVLAIIAIIYLIAHYYDKKQLNKKGLYLDARGYERNKIDNRLVHRTVAYTFIYNNKNYTGRFGEYVVHHIDKNKRNNNPNNLLILTPTEHKQIHGFQI